MMTNHNQPEGNTNDRRKHTKHRRRPFEIRFGYRLMGAKYHNVEQGTPEWHTLRCGVLTASEAHLLVTKETLKAAKNDKLRAHVLELTAQTISGFVEESYWSADMLRGGYDEITSRNLYAKHYAPVTEVGFITNDKWGFTLGYSPDGLVGDDGLLECKSKKQRKHIEVVCKYEIPKEHIFQCQQGLLVADDRKWLDFTSFCGGLPMFRFRTYPDPKIQEAILTAAYEFERERKSLIDEYNEHLAQHAENFVPTVRVLTPDDCTLEGLEGDGDE